MWTKGPYDPPEAANMLSCVEPLSSQPGIVVESLSERGPREMISQCAWCKGVELGLWHIRLPWVRTVIQGWSLRLPFGISFRLNVTHGVCPECARKIYEDARRRRPLKRFRHAREVLA
jgi:hypothetical protein